MPKRKRSTAKTNERAAASVSAMEVDDAKEDISNSTPAAAAACLDAAASATTPRNRPSPTARRSISSSLSFSLSFGGNAHAFLSQSASSASASASDPLSLARPRVRKNPGELYKEYSDEEYRARFGDKIVSHVVRMGEGSTAKADPDAATQVDRVEMIDVEDEKLPHDEMFVRQGTRFAEIAHRIRLELNGAQFTKEKIIAVLRLLFSQHEVFFADFSGSNVFAVDLHGLRTLGAHLFLDELNLYNANLGFVQAGELFSGLKTNPFISKLILRYSLNARKEYSKEARRSLFEELKEFIQQSSLIVLDLAENEIDGDEAEVLVPGFRANQTLTRVDLSRNKMRPESLGAVIRSFQAAEFKEEPKLLKYFPQNLILRAHHAVEVSELKGKADTTNQLTDAICNEIKNEKSRITELYLSDVGDLLSHVKIIRALGDSKMLTAFSLSPPFPGITNDLSNQYVDTVELLFKTNQSLRRFSANFPMTQRYADGIQRAIQFHPRLQFFPSSGIDECDAENGTQYRAAIDAKLVKNKKAAATELLKCRVVAVRRAFFSANRDHFFMHSVRALHPTIKALAAEDAPILELEEPEAGYGKRRILSVGLSGSQ